MELNFKEWLIAGQKPISDEYEIVATYCHNPNIKVEEIASRSGKSIGELYRILKKHGIPNRQKTNHENVYSFASSGMPVKKIAEFTGYTPRNVRYILKKPNGHNT